MSSAVEQLLSLAASPDPFDVEPTDLIPLQLEAANERLQVQIDRIPLLRNRAESGGIGKITERADLVPLLFAHTAYKSYGESWLTDGRWDRIAKWARTVSSGSADGFEVDGIASLDDFVDRMADTGMYLGCSSGTTGKPALIPSNQHDLDFAAQSNLSGLTWATGVVPAGDRKMIGLGPQMKLARQETARTAIEAAFSSPGLIYTMPLPPITPSSMIDMVVGRRRIADGTATPSEVAAFERISRERGDAMDVANAAVLDEVINSRGEKLWLGGMYATLYDMAEQVRANGFSGKDFNDQNMLFTAGGLKGADLPENYREIVHETFNVAPIRAYNMYSMQEINTAFPKCVADRFHIAPWVVMLPLDEPGETILDGDGEIEGRAAFFDISLEGRWGGVISGDLVGVDFGMCACGHRGPTVGQDIVRYADTLSGDKISCSGTIDAYVRGEA